MCKLQMLMFGLFFLCALAMGQGNKDDATTPWDILAANGGLAIKQCPGPEGTLHVDQIQFNSDTMVVQVSGNLMKELTDGRLVAKITPGQPPKDSNRLQRLKRKMALSWRHAYSGKANQTAPFCSKQRRCPITTGAQQLNFSFTRLPKLVIAGGYHMQLHAYDQMGKSVVCIEGALTVNHGKHGEVIRVLEDCVNRPWYDQQEADRYCEERVTNKGHCNTNDTNWQEYIYQYCRKACQWCGAASEQCQNNMPHPDEICRFHIVNTGMCDHDNHCRAACGTCPSEHGNSTDDAYYSRALWTPMVFLLVTLRSAF